jgi:3-methyladenine DNA glycosylase AlkD
MTALDEKVRGALAWLERHGSKKGREAMGRYAIASEGAFGVSMKDMQALAKSLGRDQALAEALWATGRYEARMTACYVAEPEKLTAADMDRWCRTFDNWAIADTACFALFDRTPHAWKKVAQWTRSGDEFVKRAGFALLWGLTVHDKSAPDARYLEGLGFIERGAADDRHWVKKAVNMALRATGKRNRVLNAAAVKVAKRLAASGDPAPRWIGKDALRELEGYHFRKTAKETA